MERRGGGAFGKDVLEDVIPFVEAKFRTLKDPANRALGGLSMGGGQTVAIGFPNTKFFSHLVVMSAGAGQNPEQTYADFFKNADTVNKQLKLLWLGVGKDDFALNGSKALDEALTKNNIKHTFVSPRDATSGSSGGTPARSRTADVQIITTSSLSELD